jgi:GntR family transcriptional regulator / MocR family aminotransferase
LRRRVNLSLPGLELRPEAERTLGRQLYDYFHRAILDGKLASGSRVPSTRALASSLGISRNTVLWAYDSLLAEGLLVSRKGSCTLVRSPGPPIRALPQPRSFDLWAALRAARYPATAEEFADADGNTLYIHR